MSCLCPSETRSVAGSYLSTITSISSFTLKSSDGCPTRPHDMSVMCSRPSIPLLLRHEHFSHSSQSFLFALFRRERPPQPSRSAPLKKSASQMPPPWTLISTLASNTSETESQHYNL